MTKTTEQEKRDYLSVGLSVGLSGDKQRVRVETRNDGDGFHCAVELDQAQALTLAGQIQGNAFMIRKPNTQTICL